MLEVRLRVQQARTGVRGDAEGEEHEEGEGRQDTSGHCIPVSARARRDLSPRADFFRAA